MRVIEPSYFIETEVDGMAILRRIERAGRNCYKSEDKITDETARKFVKKIIDMGHHSVIEHESLTVRFICDRGVTHEIVRHRLASYSQESTRYCNYAKDRFGNEITVIKPFGITGKAYDIWYEACEQAEKAYFSIFEHLKMQGMKEKKIPQWARDVLPNSLKTEIVMTCNVREWRHFFALRTADAAHPQMREIARPLLAELREKIPVLFDDVGVVDA